MTIKTTTITAHNGRELTDEAELADYGFSVVDLVDGETEETDPSVEELLASLEVEGVS